MDGFGMNPMWEIWFNFTRTREMMFRRPFVFWSAHHSLPFKSLSSQNDLDWEWIRSISSKCNFVGLINFGVIEWWIVSLWFSFLLLDELFGSFLNDIDYRINWGWFFEFWNFVIFHCKINWWCDEIFQIFLPQLTKSNIHHTLLKFES